MSPFEYVKEIQVGKRDLIVDAQTEKDYVPFVVNKALSYELDCVIQANEMNRRHHADKKLQFHYLINIIRARKRSYHKWVKPETSEAIDSIKLLFECSNRKAQEYLHILTDTQVELIIQKTDKGGVKK